MIYRVGLAGGLGDSALSNMNTAQLASFATSTGGSIAATSLALVGLGPIGAIVGIGTMLTSLLISQFQGCGQTCVLTSNAANQIEDLLKQNLNAYMSSNHSASAQAAALANFDNTWAKLVQYCGNPQFGKAGSNCIQDRQAGSCKWKNAGGLTPAGSGNECWNWFVGYRDPIANDPNVVPDSVTNTVVDSTTGVVNSISNIVSSSGFNLGEIGIFALILGGLFLVGHK